MLTFYVMIKFYLRQYLKISRLEYRKYINKPKDYTVSLKITEEQRNNFKQKWEK